MSIHVRTSFPDLFHSRLAILEEVVHNRHERWPSQYSQFFTMKSTNEPFENYTGISPLGLFVQRAEAETAQLDAVKQLYDKKLTPIGYALSLQHSRETLEQDRYGIFNQMNGLLGDAAGQSKDILAADLAELGDTGSAARYLSADGENIFDASHPIDFGVTTDSNLMTASDLSATSLQTAMIALESTMDDRGGLQMIMGNNLVVPRDLQFLAAQLSKSVDDPETAERAVSPFTDYKFGYTVWQYLLDADSWYLWSDYPKKVPGWIWLTQQPLDLDHDVNVLNQTAVVVATERFDYGVIEWRGVVKTPGA